MNNFEQFKQFLINFWNHNTGDWQIYLESPVPEDELRESFKQNSIPSFGFYFLLTLATIIATLGLLADSTATIIGAMIIAPLMNPIMSLAFGIVQDNSLLIRRSSLTLLTGILTTIFVAFSITTIVDITVIHQEIIARVNPTLLDLWVAIASGGAAAFAYTRKGVINALSGVAIAVALVPPLSVVSIGLSLGNTLSVAVGLSPVDNVAIGAFLLFLTNLIGIIFCAVIIFLSQKYGRILPVLKTFIILCLSLFIIALPLNNALRQILLETKVRQSLNSFIRNRQHLFPNAHLISMNSSIKVSPITGKRTIYIDLEVLALPGVVNESNVRITQGYLSKQLNQPVKLTMKVINYQVY